VSEGPWEDRHDPVGSASEEAAKLFGALGDWAREHGTELASGLAHGFAGLAGHAAAAASAAEHDLADHLATGAPECTYCPICRTVHVVREASPEVRVHLAGAAASLMQAAAAVLHAASSSRPSDRDAAVEHIDLDDDDAAAYAEDEDGTAGTGVGENDTGPATGPGEEI